MHQKHQQINLKHFKFLFTTNYIACQSNSMKICKICNVRFLFLLSIWCMFQGLVSCLLHQTPCYLTGQHQCNKLILLERMFKELFGMKSCSCVKIVVKFNLNRNIKISQIHLNTWYFWNIKGRLLSIFKIQM